MNWPSKIAFICSLVFAPVVVASDQTPNAPATDRVGYPQDYADHFIVLRVVNKPQDSKIVTIYGNAAAASVTNVHQLPYPYGSVLVMESASAAHDAQGKPISDDKGNLRKGEVTGLHVMRREQGFGAAYGKYRAGEWEYVEYKPDGTYLTPPAKSASCAECHAKAGAQRDFVYRGRLAAEAAP